MLLTDVSQFARNAEVVRPARLLLTVKSLDQVERRTRLIEAKERGRLGRIDARPVAAGLLVGIELHPGQVLNAANAFLVREFREPRGLISLGGGELLVSEIDRVFRLDLQGRILQEYRHPFFAFLHSLDVNLDTRRFLVVSSGYDCLLEMDLDSGEVRWEWYAWEHGFNPNHDGVYLARNREQQEAWRAQGITAQLIDPAEYGEHGLMTSQRANHPNSASYHPGQPDVILATLGHSGEVIEIDKDSGDWRVVIGGLQAMPHGIMPHRQGWLVTNTMAGECWLTDARFQVVDKLVTARLPGKPPAMAAHEWLQAVLPWTDPTFIGLDANRGLIVFDVERQLFQVLAADENWCIHHAVFI